jgi:hypothetical protein
MATVDIDDEFYKTTVKPNLDSLTSTLRVDIIQQKLQQEGLITDRDDQVLRLEMKTPIRRATYFLDILQQWDAGSYWKFCKIVWESTASCPAHKKVARLLKLSEASFHNNPALESQGAGGLYGRTHSLSRRARYPMNAVPRGIALIINNRHFFGRLGERMGTDKDAEALVNLFQWLRFEVRRIDNRKSFEIQGALRELAKEDHSNYNCVIVAILSHGKDGGIYGTDEQAVSVAELTGYFRSSPSLSGKPKLFFLQACRGTTMDHGVAMDGPESLDVEKHIQDILAETEADAKMASAIPSDADFLISYATTPGFVSWRHKENGSWYIQSIFEIFQRHAEKEDLISMLTMVNEKVATEFQSTYDSKNVKQMPGPVTMLTKKLFFF